MKHPIAHYQHTERPVGTFTKCDIIDKKLQVLCDIYDTPDTDDVWEEIEKGELNKFSIYGRRLQANAECALEPHQRFSPCVTKALDLFSISLVGNNAINEKTFLEVVKGDTMPFGEYKDFAACERANKDKGDSGAYCASVEHKITGKWPAEKGEPMPEEEEKKKEEEEVEKGGPEGLIHEESNMSEVMKRLGAVEEAVKCFQETKKSEESMEDKKEEKKEEEVQKAEPTPEVKKEEVIEKAVMADVITKAFVEDEIKKAKDEFTKGLADLKAELEELKKVKIEKGGKIVILQEEFQKANPQESNLDAIGGK